MFGVLVWNWHWCFFNNLTTGKASEGILSTQVAGAVGEILSTKIKMLFVRWLANYDLHGFKAMKDCASLRKHFSVNLKILHLMFGRS